MKHERDSKWPLVVTVLALAVIGVLYFRGLQQPLNDLDNLSLPTAPTPVAVPPDEEPATPAEPTAINPIEQSEAGRQQPAADAPNTPASPPPLDDAAFAAALEALLGSNAFSQWVVNDDLVNRIVVSVDNLAHDKLPVRLWPLRPLTNLPKVNGEGGALRFASDNAARYDAYIELLQKVDMKSLAALYVRNYPRFQDAYQALGYPKAYFNDRLVDVMEHLLVTPEIDTPLALVQPTVMYKFADEDLESRSVGQKLLLRMGPAHASVVKARLRELLRLISRQDNEARKRVSGEHE